MVNGTNGSTQTNFYGNYFKLMTDITVTTTHPMPRLNVTTGSLQLITEQRKRRVASQRNYTS